MEEVKEEILKEEIFCQYCGKKMEEDAKFCSSCGKSTEKISLTCECGTSYENNQKFCSKCGKKLTTSFLSSSTENTEDFSQTDIDENKGLSILCYLGILLLIPLLAKPQSKYLKFHSNQGILLMIIEIICTFILFIPILGWIVGFIGYLFAMICTVIGIINAIKGKTKRLPLIGKFNILR